MTSVTLIHPSPPVFLGKFSTPRPYVYNALEKIPTNIFMSFSSKLHAIFVPHYSTAVLYIPAYTVGIFSNALYTYGRGVEKFPRKTGGDGCIRVTEVI
jgi:hypothetical protein